MSAHDTVPACQDELARFQSTPAYVVQGFLLSMRAESVVAQQTRRAAERDARRR